MIRQSNNALQAAKECYNKGFEDIADRYTFLTTRQGVYSHYKRYLKHRGKGV